MARPKTHICNDPSVCRKCVENLRRKQKYAEEPAERLKRVSLARSVRRKYKERVNAADRKRWKSNSKRREDSKESNKKYYWNNPEKQRARLRDKYYRFRDYYIEHAIKKRAHIANAFPKWLTEEHREVIKVIYKLAGQDGRHVDHIVPLRGKDVCGLHVPWNMQILDSSENLSKGNRLTDEGNLLAWT